MPFVAASSARNVAAGPPGGSAILSGAIEKPVGNISVSTTSDGWCSATAFAIWLFRRSCVARLSSQTMSCWVPTTFIWRPSSGETLQAGHGLVDHVVALAEREAHEAAA